MKYSTSKQSGLSLVEILVALVISLFLLGGIIQVYLGNKATYRFSDASSRVQENGRFALDAITTDARLAGFFGCIDIINNPELVQNHLNSASANFDNTIHRFTTLPPIQITANAGINNSDDLAIIGSKPGQVSLSADLPSPGSAAIQVTGSTQFSNNDFVLITNCWTSDIFEADTVTTNAGVSTLTHTTTSPTNTPGNMDLNNCSTAGQSCLYTDGKFPRIPLNLEGDYTANNSSVYILQHVRYSIQPAASGSGEPALWRSENGNNEELIEGVERMLVLYGVNTDNDDIDHSPNQYVNSATAVNPNRVTAIRVFLVVRSEQDNVLDQNQDYVLNGVPTTAPDRRLRQVFSTTINLRNR